MDPVSMLFSTFLATMTNSIHGQMTDMMGVELQASVVEYQNHQIDYQYQLWKIKPESVCNSKKLQLINEYSTCTTAAKNMFTEICQHLNQNPRNHWKYTKLKNMYCNAAVSYTPVTASISRLDPVEAEILEARQACSLLTLQAREARNANIETQRQAACEYARQVQEKYR